MCYDPFLRKDFFESSIWYGEFLIFHNIGVCQVPNHHVQAVREALARFIYATRALPGNRPGSSFIIHTGEIDANNLEAYIQEIHRESSEQ